MQHVQKTTTTSKPRIPDISRPGGPATIWMGCRSKRLNNHWFYCVFVPACWTKTVALCCFRSQTFKNHWFHYLFALTRWTNLSFIICSLQNVEQPIVLLRCRSKTLKKGRKRWKRASHGFRTWRRNDSPERKWGTLYRQAVWGMNNINEVNQQNSSEQTHDISKEKPYNVFSRKPYKLLCWRKKHRKHKVTHALSDPGCRNMNVFCKQLYVHKYLSTHSATKPYTHDHFPKPPCRFFD